MVSLIGYLISTVLAPIVGYVVNGKMGPEIGATVTAGIAGVGARILHLCDPPKDKAVVD